MGKRVKPDDVERIVEPIVKAVGELRGDVREIRGELGEIRGEMGEIRGEMGEIRKTLLVQNETLLKQTEILIQHSEILVKQQEALTTIARDVSDIRKVAVERHLDADQRFKRIETHLGLPPWTAE